jgi:membrane protease YdiL (CAAX protease family)
MAANNFIDKSDKQPTYRVRPTVYRGIMAYLVYMLIFYAIFILTKIDYTRISESADTLLHWFIPGTLGMIVVPIAFVTFYGWWKPSIVEQKKLSARASVIPVITALTAIVNLLTGDCSRLTPGMWLMLIVGSFCVGFNEEMINRGTLIVALRSKYGEKGVWLISTAMFAVFHLPNIFFGTGPIGLIQVPIAFGMGSVFYLARRSTGTLLSAMALHTIWDFSVFATNSIWMGIIGPIIGIAAVVTVIVQLTHEKAKNRLS